jgi:hypothetical protein
MDRPMDGPYLDFGTTHSNPVLPKSNLSGQFQIEKALLQ